MSRPPIARLTLLYGVACLVMLAPICSFGALGAATYQGDARLIVWTLAWDNHALLDGVRGFFDANIFYPEAGSLAYSEHLFGISLFTLPVYALTRNPVLAYNLVWILSYLSSAAAAHYLAWRHTRDHAAAAVAGLAYAFCFFRMHHGPGHLHVLWGFWIPLSLVAMDSWLTTVSWRALWLLAAIVTAQALASWYQAVMIFVADALFMSFAAASGLIAATAPRGPAPCAGDAREPGRAQPESESHAGSRTSEPGAPAAWRFSRTPASIGRIALQAVAGALVALAIVWPFARHYHALTSGGPAEAAANAADLAAYLVPPENTWFGQRLIARGIEGPRWIWGEQTLFLGWVTMALATCGAAAAIRGRGRAARRLRFFILLAAAAMALAAGPSASEVASGVWGWTPFGLLARIPGVSLFRVPARFTALTTLALAVLAGAGAAWLRARFGRAGRWTVIAAVPLLLAEFYVVNFPGGPPAPYPIPPVYRMLGTLPPGPVLSLPDFAGTPLWFEEADYGYFSTAHWQPIVNGYSRAEPSGFAERMARVSRFPDPDAVAGIRAAGVRYVVVHAARFPQGGAAAAGRGGASGAFRLLARFENDYLYEVEAPVATSEKPATTRAERVR
ncbi:MAG: hypothetical protein IT176_05005 [Acidobacteria bacterium]|nr:hypothetical protein [Acidobacteriota bacterium]